MEPRLLGNQFLCRAENRRVGPEFRAYVREDPVGGKKGNGAPNIPQLKLEKKKEHERTFK